MSLPEKGGPEWCREDLGPEANYNRCGAPAEFILWGKLLPPEALGPRCYDHAAAHVGHLALSDPSYAIYHLPQGSESMSREDSNYMTDKELATAARILKCLNDEKRDHGYELAAEVYLIDSNGEQAGLISIGENGEYVLWPGSSTGSWGVELQARA